MKKYLWRYEAVAVSAIGVFCVIFLVQTYNYGHKAALFPRLVCFFVLFLILFFIVSRLRRMLKRRGVPSQDEPIQAEGITEAGQPQGVKWTLTFGLAMGFCLLMYLIGFGPATVCYLAVHTYLAGYRKVKMLFLYALAVGAIMVFFGYLFKIPLPEGILVGMVMQYLQNL
jgi:FtsH-binding integral membrane protein